MRDRSSNNWNDYSKDEPGVSFPVQLRDFLGRNLNWILGGALALLLLQDVLGTHGLLAMRLSRQEAAQVQKEIDHYNEENHQLQDSVKSLKSDPAAIERIAREEMGLARRGEYVFKIAPRSTEPSGNSSVPNSQPPKP
jgi:cell division protein FtsB